MIFGIVGLGLIGASFAKTVRAKTDARILGFDSDDSVIKKAVDEKVIDEVLSSDSLCKCDVVIVALYPKDSVDFIKEQCSCFKNGALVFDACGVKSAVVYPLEECVKSNSFTFIGAHPMAGNQNFGYDFSSDTLFLGASMILTPFEWTPKDRVLQSKELFLSLGFGEVRITTPSEHDKIIAFTSQLAHVVSNAYIKSPTAQLHHGFSAGSYKDLTRVAKLNESMWTELFLDNPDALSDEIDSLCERLSLYSKAIRQGDKDTLLELLRQGREIKERVDKA